MQERLMELLQDIDHYPEKTCPKYESGEECGDCKYKLDTAMGCDIYARKVDYMIGKGVIIPPVMVNIFAYFCSQNKKVQEGYIERITINKNGMHIAVCYDGIRFKVFEPCDFGKTVFLTKEEAKQALKGGAE